MLSRFDADGDGKLTREELPERMRPQFERMDRNDDGVVDADEMQAMASRRRRR
jgi:collagen type III alpha